MGGKLENDVRECQCQGRNRLIENNPAFKARIEEAYAEYQSQGGISVETLIKKLKKHRGRKKVQSCFRSHCQYLLGG